MEEKNDVKIKICGIRRSEDIDYVNLAMPDFVGYIFVKGRRRYVSPQMAVEFSKKLNKKISPVAVFLNSSLEEVDDILKLLGKTRAIKYIQFHGDENEDFIQRLKKMSGYESFGDEKPLIIKAIGIADSDDALGIAEKINSCKSVDFYLFDGKNEGSGVAFNWEKIRNIDIDKPFFLAGGLGYENVLEGIACTRPYAVDLSSSVETDGNKDLDKMNRLIRRIRNNE